MSDNVMNGPDLNRIRQTVLENQAHGNTRPKDPNKQITADREGGLHIGPVTTGQAVSVVPQETFASRLDEDRRTASEKLPTNTTEVTTREGVTGFLYRINSSFGYKFEMFAYYDGSQYQVMVIEPEIED
jgi:hypothetical protein